MSTLPAARVFSASRTSSIVRPSALAISGGCGTQPVSAEVPKTYMRTSSANRGASPLTRSPHAHAGVGREIELAARLHPERVVPRVDVASGVGAVFRGRVPVGHDLVAQRLRPVLAPPGLAEGDEEPLVSREPLLRGPRLSAVGRSIRVEGGGDARDVGDVFGDRQLSIDVKSGQRLVRIVLRGESLGGLPEMREVF